jgi:hypothetical protein
MLRGAEVADVARIHSNAGMMEAAHATHFLALAAKVSVCFLLSGVNVAGAQEATAIAQILKDTRACTVRECQKSCVDDCHDFCPDQCTPA